jgi:hypothetical protein
MRLKPYSGNLAKRALRLSVVVFLLCGCISPIPPTYLKENIDEAIQNICKKEYNLGTKAKLTGQTLWVYIPLEDIFVKSDKPEKYIEKFEIKANNVGFQHNALRLEYLINTVPEKEQYQNFKYNKAALENMQNAWKALRRVLFSMERLKKGQPEFIYVVTADIKNGLEIRELFYLEDLKKVSYEFISVGEYQHRTIQEVQERPEAKGDKEGLYLNYRDIPIEEFIVGQIRHRIKLKFQKPEVDKSADIDKEIIKLVAHTLKTYGFRDFSEVELNNLFTRNKTILNKAAIWARPIE